MKHDKHLHAQEGWQLSTRTALRINGPTEPHPLRARLS